MQEHFVNSSIALKAFFRSRTEASAYTKITLNFTNIMIYNNIFKIFLQKQKVMILYRYKKYQLYFNFFIAVGNLASIDSELRLSSYVIGVI